LDTLSTLFGWIYFVAWSVSFYPQVVLNFRRKSVQGLRIEYTLYNEVGFFCYSWYVIANYRAQQEYHLTESFYVNDIAFAVHAFVLTTVQLVQIFWYRHTIDGPPGVVYSVILTVAFVAQLIAAAAGALPWVSDTRAGGTYFWDGAYCLAAYCSLAKVIITAVKYVPQAVHNCRRKSTIGWSICNVALDFTGGTFSFGQNFIQVANDGNWNHLFGNPGKLALSVLSIVFDILFFVQHFVLFRDRRDPALLQQRSEGGSTVVSLVDQA